MATNNSDILLSRTDECIQALCEEMFYEFSIKNRSIQGLERLIEGIYNLCVFLVENENKDVELKMDLDNDARLRLVRYIYDEFTNDQMLHYKNTTLTEKMSFLRELRNQSEIFNNAVMWAKVNLAGQDSIDKAAGLDYGAVINAI